MSFFLTRKTILSRRTRRTPCALRGMENTCKFFSEPRNSNSVNPVPPHLFVAAVREQLWLLLGANQRLAEERFELGWSRTREIDGQLHLEVSSGLAQLDPARILSRSPAAIESDLRGRLEIDPPPPSIRRDRPLVLRINRSARLVATSSGERTSDTTTITISSALGKREISVVTTPDHLETDLLRLDDAVSSPPQLQLGAWQSLPMVWIGGTGAVLLHEAAGHPAERSIGARWPAWVSIRDDPRREGLGAMTFDDCGEDAMPSRLDQGERPHSRRRASFRDIPTSRMSHLVVEHSGGDVTLPDEHVEISLIDRGGYDPLTDRLRLEIAVASLVQGERRTRLEPFVYDQLREDVPGSLTGACGALETYPGVICSSEGYKLPVGSTSTRLLTEIRRTTGHS